MLSKFKKLRLILIIFEEVRLNYQDEFIFYFSDRPNARNWMLTVKTLQGLYENVAA